MKRPINRALMSLSLASDLQLNRNAMAPDNDNSNMKILLWNVKDAKALYNISWLSQLWCDRFHWNVWNNTNTRV